MVLITLLKLALTVAVFIFEASAAPSCQSYEYIVIGSGAGGGSLAVSLAQKGHSVFLIEAGGDHGDNPLQMVPLLGAAAAENETMSWEFFVNHYRDFEQGRRDSKYTYRLPNGELYIGLDPPEDATPLGTFYPRGSTVGGSTQVNAQGFVKISDKDWDYIASFTGDKSWASPAMEKYFIELEHALYIPEGSEGHGFDGPIYSSRNNLSYVVNRTESVAILSELERLVSGTEVENAEHLAQLMLRDINHADHHYNPGVYQDVVSVGPRRRRSGARNMIIEAIEAGYPITLSTHSLATKVLIKDDGPVPVAYGVEYLVGEGLYGADRRYNPEQQGELKTVTALKEVIVAGGAFNTPQILKLSGIGPREELEKYGIPVIVDLPGVGANLQDHTEGALAANATQPWANNPNELCFADLSPNGPCFTEWFLDGAGPLGEGSAPQVIRIKTGQSTTGQIDVWVVGLSNGLARGFYPGYSQPLEAPSTWSWIMVKVHAPGRFTNGTVTLQSADPRIPPEINFDWLQGEEGESDLAALSESAELLMKGFKAAPEQYQPVVRHAPAEDEDLGQGFRDEAFGHHASSTCRMGPVGDDRACVDPQLRVKGVKNLRVADASVFPYTPGAFPAMAFHIIGLKAADLLLHADV